jgi:hypothetical protein
MLVLYFVPLRVLNVYVISEEDGGDALTATYRITWRHNQKTTINIL